MDEQKKQKVLIGVLAVAAIGAGGYWYMQPAEESGPNRTLGTGRTTRKQAEKPRSDEVKSRRKTAAKAEKTERASRKARPEAERKTAGRRKAARGRKKKVKKEMVFPAS